MTYQPTDRAESSRQRSAIPQFERPVKRSIADRNPGEISLPDVWRILVKRRRSFYLCLGASLLIALLASLILPRRYEAVGKITLDFDSNALQDAFSGVAGLGDADNPKLMTQVQVLATDALAWEVIKSLRLDQRHEAVPKFLGVGPEICLSGTDQLFDRIDSTCKDALLREFRRRYRVQPVPRTQIIEIRYRSQSPQLAAQVVNTMVAVYTKASFQTRYDAAMRASNWVSGQLKDAKDNAEKEEQDYISFQKKTGIVGIDEDHSVLMDRLNGLNQQLIEAEATRIVREARYRASLEGDPEALAEMQPGGPLEVLHSEEAALNNQYAELTSKYDDQYPKVKQVKAQLEKAKADLKAEVARSADRIKHEYLAAQNAESLLRDEFERQKQQVYSTSESSAQLALLKRDVEGSRNLYEDLVKQLNEAGILAGLRSTSVTLIEPASIPIRHAEPHLGLNLAMGLVGGTILGVLVSFLRNNVDSRIASRQDLAEFSALSVVGIIPRVEDAPESGRSQKSHPSSPLVTLADPDGIVSDAYRTLRTAVILSNPGTPPKVIMVTSPLPGEGKSTTSANLAIVFAQRNQRILVVDADMRGAGLNRSFRLPNGNGLSAVLAGQEPASYYRTIDGLPQMTILPAGERPPKPPDLLDSDRMREQLSNWRRDFEFVIIDTPPVIGLSDAVILSTMVDAVVLVVRADQSRRAEVQLAEELLANANALVVGILLNGIEIDNTTPYGLASQAYGRYDDPKKGEGGNG